MGMTFEEKGAYMELLMMQFNRGHMTSHMIGQAVGQLWDNVKVKFEVDEDGRYFNARLELEKEKRKKYIDSRSNNKMGRNQHSKSVKKDGRLIGHMSKHMENENENENDIDNVVVAFEKNVKVEAKELGMSAGAVDGFLRHWTERDFESKQYAWQTVKPFIIRSRLKGWMKNDKPVVNHIKNPFLV